MPRAQNVALDAEHCLNRPPFWIPFPRVSLSTAKVISDLHAICGIMNSPSHNRRVMHSNLLHLVFHS